MEPELKCDIAAIKATLEAGKDVEAL